MSEKTAETWITSPMQALTTGSLEACLVHIYPSGPSMGRRYPLGTAALVLGRGEGCEIRIDDTSVSRRHARIVPDADGYLVEDLQSTNGTFVNDRVTDGQHRLHDGDYLRVGNCIYRYLAGGNIESEYHEEIYRLTIIDGLTQINNRRFLVDFLDREVARSNRHHRPLSLLMIDLDKFKSINDDHGHLCGDFVLRELSERMRHSVRREDLFARYGGEEFALVLVETLAPQAIEVAERIRKTIAEKPFVFDAQNLEITVSIGVATTLGDKALTSLELVKMADDLLYSAKRAGRNRVVH